MSVTLGSVSEGLSDRSHDKTKRSPVQINSHRSLASTYYLLCHSEMAQDKRPEEVHFIHGEARDSYDSGDPMMSS